MTSIARARRVDVSGEMRAIGTVADADYEDAFTITAARSSPRSAESWMRLTLEGAPRLVRWFIVTGWRFVLGFNLRPLSSQDRLLGWRIVVATPDTIVLEQHSALFTANLIMRIAGADIAWATLVRFEHRTSRSLWAVTGVIHRRIVPYVLRRAATHG